eukprot:934712-Prymnesium_polylepis.2
MPGTTCPCARRCYGVCNVPASLKSAAALERLRGDGENAADSAHCPQVRHVTHTALVRRPVGAARTSGTMRSAARGGSRRRTCFVVNRQHVELATSPHVRAPTISLQFVHSCSRYRARYGCTRDPGGTPPYALDVTTALDRAG